MHTNIDSIIAYWRDSLADADRVSVDLKRVKQSPRVHPSALAGGRVPPELAADLLAAGTAGSAKQRGPAPQAQLISVLLCPIVAYPQGEVTQASGDSSPLLPLWVPASLAANGELLPPDELLPWVAREMLEPTDRPRVVLGSVAKLERFFETEAQPGNEDGWATYWAYCCRMFKSVAGLSDTAFAVEGYRLAGDTAYVIPAELVQGSRQHVVRLYERLRADNCLPPLLQRYGSLAEQPLRPLLSEAEQQGLAARHLGQMGNVFPLSPSQRQALHHVLHLQAGEILAVNGPPGTGKTTLIQSIVASLWVEAALHGEEPPIILAASTNNQAVTNIIESFGKGAHSQSQLSRRWLPDVTSYGLYCVADSQGHREVVSQKGLQAVLPTSERDLSGFFAARETTDYLTRATAAYLEQCAQYFQRRPEGLEEAQALLHQQLREIAAELKGAAALWGRLRGVQERIATLRRTHGTLEFALTALRRKLQETESSAQALWHLIDGWKRLKAGRSFFDRFRAVQIQQANQAYFAAHPSFEPPPAMDDTTIEHTFRERWDEVQRQKLLAEEQVRAVEADQQQLSELKQLWWQWCQRHGVQADSESAVALLDTRLRHRAFCLATHYWEARWLLETRALLNAGSQSGRNGREQQIARWRRYAKLTPCFVSTLFMAPRFFSAWEKSQSAPLYELCDLLIIDEAGQVPADVAGATFALAKRALVVGDIFQIEPVYTLNSKVDAGNLRRHRVARSEAEQEHFRALGLSATKGSVMAVAQRASAYQQVSLARGMFLSEHRRCLPEIITISNELVYEGRLQPLRTLQPDERPPLPALGYAHIPGKCVTVRGSRENAIEAETIVAWLTEQRERLEDCYQKPLAELAGIVTPFSRQAQLLERSLRRAKLGRLAAGTIHALQGAERRVIIFSPVYQKPGNLFFDIGPRMLNVAVSRAQDSFLVFGQMVLFEPLPASVDRRPSSVLARHLFHGPGVELTISIARPVGFATRGEVVRPLKTLQEHRDTLAQGLREARRRIVIVSPYLSEAAIRADAVDTAINAARRRGVEVIIYTDNQLDVDTRTQRLKPHAAAARQKLRGCGADLRVVERIHNKILCVDEAVFVSGSFNWLSAVRDEENQYQRYEHSVRYEGPNVATMIADTLSDMAEMPLVSSVN